MIKVVGKTNPYVIKIATDTEAFQIDNFYEILDEVNDNPICRIIKSESLSIETVRSTEREIYNDVSAYFPETKSIYIATAKVETYIKKPVLAGSDVRFPDFEKIKPFTVKSAIDESFVLGEINGTDVFMDTVPAEYRDLFMVRKDGKMVKQTSVPLLFDYKKLSEAPHIGLFGGSGSGKTFALKVIVEEIMKKQIPTILFDPHLEMNFKKARKNMPKELCHDFNTSFKIFTIGNNVGIDFAELSSNELLMILEFAGSVTEAMKTVLSELHSPGDSLVMLQSNIETLIKIKNLLDVHKDVSKLGLTSAEEALWRRCGNLVVNVSTLNGLLQRLISVKNEGIFECGINEIKRALLNKKTCVLRGEMKALNIVGSYLISQVYHTRKAYVDGKDVGVEKDKFPPFIVAMDEAHIFCPKTNESSPIKSILRTIAQEGRKYGAFEIMATQRPSLLDETIVAQMSTKFIFKLNIKEDLNSVEKETDLSREEIDRLPYINSGESFISSSIYGKTMSVLIRFNVTDVESKANPFNELEEETHNSLQDELLKLLPIDNRSMPSVISSLKKSCNKDYTIAEITNELEELVKNGEVFKMKGPLGSTYTK